MAISEKNYNEKLNELEAKTHDTGFFQEFMGSENIPIESLGAMGANTTLEEFLREMKSHGLEVHLKPKAQDETPVKTNPESVNLNSVITNTAEHKKAYAKNLDEAREKLGGDTGLVSSILENTPESAIDNINTASYEGEFDELKNLSKDLNKN